VRFHPEIPLIALLGLMHARVPGLVLILRGRRDIDDGGIDEDSFANEKTPLFKVGIDRFENGGTEIVLF